MTIQETFDLALQHHQAGRLPEAEALYRQILAAQPWHADALRLLGVIAHQVGQHEMAIGLIRRAVELNPDLAAAHSNLGEAHRAVGQWEAAAAAYRRALQARPDSPDVLNNLSNILRLQGQHDEAVAMCRRAIELRPAYAEAHSNLGLALAEQGDADAAILSCRRALELQPNYPNAYNNLGLALKESGQWDEAVAAFRQALALRPSFWQAHCNLGSVLKDHGQLREALAAYQSALALNPSVAGVCSNLIYLLHFLPEADEPAAAAAHEHWRRHFSEPAKPCIQRHTNRRDPERRLRIGYVSPEFRDHVTGRYLRPLFDCHDRRQFEIVCYSGVSRSDTATARFREQADLWRNTVGVTDEAFAGMVREDAVDILVDLTQHLTGNRLTVFDRKPAPVRVSFAGYPESTGLEAIEYRISDRYLENGEAQEAGGGPIPGRGRERVFLIDSFWCYDPCGMDVAVNALPAKQGGRVTFGNLNAFGKVNESALGLWARVLARVKEARLILLSDAGSHRQRTLVFLDREGVAPNRVEFITPRARREYLELYHQIDIILDTFPYNGHTTSLDALWMGVPVISLAGQTPVSRAGWSQLSNLGLAELAAFSADAFVEVATQLARDLPRIAELRRTLRTRMEASVLMDAPRFARGIEAAYRAMWRQWCSEEAAPNA